MNLFGRHAATQPSLCITCLLAVACMLGLAWPTTPLQAQASASQGDLDAESMPATLIWDNVPDRRWPGPAIWANRLQDWSVRDGKLQCAYQYGGSDWRTAHVITHDLAAEGNGFEIELILDTAAQGHAGVLLGGGEGKLDYQQASLIQGAPGVGGGVLVDIDFAKHTLNIRDFGSDAEQMKPTPQAKQKAKLKPGGTLTLKVIGQVKGADIQISTVLLSGSKQVASTSTVFPADKIVGNAAIVSMGGTQQAPHRFSKFTLSGDRVSAHPDRAYGPIAGVLYSVANDDLKVGVQCMSFGKTIDMGPSFGQGWRAGVQIEQQQADGSWQAVGRPVGVSEPDYYALVRLKGYDTTQPADFRVVLLNGPEDAAPYHFHVPAEPTDGNLVIGGVSCTGTQGRKGLMNKKKLGADESFVGMWTPANVWAPFAGIRDPLIERKPDIVFFTGDQLYEWWPTPIDMSVAFPHEDYLYKWLIWHWSFKDLTARVPCLVQTDDHDVWHPNIWGEGARLMTEGWDWGGGFIKSHYFINMVQRTMCGHNPDPYDAAPSDSGVTNYFCTFSYGGVDFALLEDRKFKSALPSIEAGAEPKLLGDTQLQMLAEWAEAPNPAPARIVVSQTVYSTINTLPDGEHFADHDSNGWPKPARDKAVALFGKAGAFLFTGDQHLASASRLKTKSGPGIYQFCQPSGGCIWWRWFYPQEDLRLSEAKPGQPYYVGDYVDAFGNPFELLAAANPAPRSQNKRHTNPPQHIVTAAEKAAGIGTQFRMHDGEGYGVVEVDVPNNRLVLECWPDLNARNRQPYGQFPGWPIELDLDALQRN